MAVAAATRHNRIGQRLAMRAVRQFCCVSPTSCAKAPITWPSGSHASRVATGGVMSGQLTATARLARSISRLMHRWAHRPAADPRDEMILQRCGRWQRRASTSWQGNSHFRRQPDVPFVMHEMGLLKVGLAATQPIARADALHCLDLAEIHHRGDAAPLIVEHPRPRRIRFRKQTWGRNFVPRYDAVQVSAVPGMEKSLSTLPQLRTITRLAMAMVSGRWAITTRVRFMDWTASLTRRSLIVSR